MKPLDKYYIAPLILILLAISMLVIVLFLRIKVHFAEKQVRPETEQTIHEVVVDYTTYNQCIEYLKKYETLVLEPYKLGNHHYIGYGQQVSSNHPPITEQQADSLLYSTFDWYVEFVAEKYKVYGNQALALALLWYNVKPASILKSDMHYCLINEIEDAERIRSSWLSLCNYKGKPHEQLRERRQFEIAMYFNLN